MASININIPDDKAQWLVQGLATRFGYSDFLPNPDFNPTLPIDASTNPDTIPNPQTKVQFAKAMVIEFIKKEAAQGYINANYTTQRQLADQIDIN